MRSIHCGIVVFLVDIPYLVIHFPSVNNIDEERIGAKRKKKVQHFGNFFGDGGGAGFGGGAGGGGGGSMGNFFSSELSSVAGLILGTGFI